ncbi:hypothetical protein OHA18_23085 [Kribbella sp. NBC_00709]
MIEHDWHLRPEYLYQLANLVELLRRTAHLQGQSVLAELPGHSLDSGDQPTVQSLAESDKVVAVWPADQRLEPAAGPRTLEVRGPDNAGYGRVGGSKI